MSNLDASLFFQKVETLVGGNLLVLLFGCHRVIRCPNILLSV